MAMRHRMIRGWFFVSAALPAIVPVATAKAQVPWVSGTVFDSVSRVPLRGATVRFVRAEDPSQVRTAASDSTGRYAIALAPGKYLADFDHAVLDSLGFDPDSVEMQVGNTMVQHHFATPSPRTLIGAVCGPGTRSGAMLVGYVRDADNAAVLPGANVFATWSEVDSSGPFPSVVQRVANVAVSNDGWFAACDLPAERPVLVRGYASDDSTGLVRVSLATGSVMIRRFLVPARTPGSATPLPKTAMLRATVRDSAGRPVAGARATVWGVDDEANASPGGVVSLGGLPAGTQTVEVNAIGYEPALVPVDLSAGASTTVNVVLGARATVLSGVTVTGAAARARLAGFRERMADAEKGINFGYFVTEEEIERRKPTLFSNLLEGFGGIEVQRLANPRNVIIRGGIRHGALRCPMAVYLDNVRIIGGLGARSSAENVNELVDPTTVVGVEIYPYPVGVPPRYQSLNGMCGVVLIWTK